MKIGFIGTGNMGGTLATAVSKGAKNSSIMLYDVDKTKAEELAEKIGAAYADLKNILNADFVFLGVKPQILPKVLEDIKGSINKNTVFVSMAAGVSVASVQNILGKVSVIRIMPNTPAAFGEGMTLLCSENTGEEKIEIFKEIVSASGRLMEVDEKLIDAASAVSGCGPAFVFMFISALADGGVECGLPYNTALTLAAQTVLGSAKTVLESGIHPEALKNAVCSPGGTTIEGVHALENGAFRAAAMNAVKAAFEKTLRLGK